METNGVTEEEEETETPIQVQKSKVSFIVPPEFRKRVPVAGKKKPKSRPAPGACHKTVKELSCAGIRRAFIRFWSGFPLRVWAFFVDALYIPAYRWEWHKYREWSYAVHGRGAPTDPERRPRKYKQRVRRSASEEYYSYLNMHKGCRRLVFNVSGVRFETQLRTLERFPKTLLGNHEERIRYWDPESGEYFLDRQPSCFESVLYFYQTKGARLERPLSIPFHVFEDEIKFYDLGGNELSKLLAEMEGFEMKQKVELPKNLLQRKLWVLLEDQYSSKQARIMAYASIIAISLSTVASCVETLGIFDPDQGPSTVVVDIRDVFFATETVCLSFFTLEFLLRFWSSPNKGVFLKGITNLIDFVAILPYYIKITLAITGGITKSSGPNEAIKTVGGGSDLERIFIILKTIRAFRILKFSRFSKGLRILGLTLQASLRELALLCFFLAVGVIIFSSALFFAESGPGSKYTSIPHTFYWGVCTMTTLGYGGEVPVTFIGKIVGSLCAITGVLTLALPVPVILSNFNYFYHRDLGEMRHRKVGPEQYVKTCPFRPTCLRDDNEGKEDEDFKLPEENELMNFSSNQEFLDGSPRRVKGNQKTEVQTEPVHGGSFDMDKAPLGDQVPTGEE